MYCNYDCDKETKEPKKTKKQQEKEAKEVRKRDLMEAFGSAIAEARKLSGMSIEKTAKKIGIKPEDLEEIEQGKKDITISDLIDLGVILGKSFESFMGVSAFYFIMGIHFKAMNKPL